jgi:hypothetical protein
MNRTRTAIESLPPYFDRYILKVADDVSIMDAFDDFGTSFLAKHESKLKALEDKVYAPEKWTAKQIIQHLIDTERIFAYRTLRFARRDTTPLPGFDENAFAASANVSHRSMDDLLYEFEIVRNSTKLLFESFGNDEYTAEGAVMGKPISVLAMGFTIIGHPIHHIQVLEERYYPLL